MNDFSSPRRMGVGAYVILFIKTLRESVGILFVGGASLIFREAGNSISMTMLRIAAILTVALAFALIMAFSRYYFRKFHIEGDRLIFTHGFAAKNTTSIPLEKIHNLSTRKGLLYRLLDMRGIAFDTLASDKFDVELILDESDWKMLLRRVDEGEKAEEAKESVTQAQSPQDEMLRISNFNIIKGAFCQNHLKGFAVLAAGLVTVFDSLNGLGGDTASRVYDYIDAGAGEYLSSAWRWISFFAAVYLTVAVFWIGKIILRYANMTITLSDNIFTMESGLISRFTCRLARSKVTFVSIKQNPVEKFAGCQTIILRQAYNATDEKRFNKIRIYGSSLGGQILGWWLNGGDSGDVVEDRHILSAKSGKGLFILKFIPQLAGAALVTYVLVHISGMLALMLSFGSAYVIFAAIRAVMAWKHSRITLDESDIKVDNGNVARISNYIKYNNVEGVEVRCTPVSAITKRASLRLSTNAGSFRIYSLKIDLAYRLRDIILSKLQPTPNDRWILQP